MDTLESLIKLDEADGKQAAAMRRATKAAERLLDRCVDRMGRAGPDQVARRRLIAAAGQPMVAEAIRRYRSGEEIEIEFAAWVTLALRELRVRDDAWARMLPEHGSAHSRLWTDLTRLAQPGYVAAPASLLAFVAWQQGDGALANVALDRALADSRRYSMAKLLRRALDSGAPPSMARLPMTPEEVEASYDAQEAGAATRRRKTMDTLEGLIKLDEGTLSEEEEAELFQHLVDTGLAWRLQGRIGRQAAAMIEAGIISQARGPRPWPLAVSTEAQGEATS
jgi:Domain of unknown function (DUF4192)